jgi:fatty acid synthase
MEIFLKETSFHGIMLDSVFTAPFERKRMVFDVISEGIKSGAIQPLVRTVFAEDEVEQAFRYSCL